MSRPQSSWIGHFLTALAIGSGIGYVAAAYSVSRWLTRPSPQRPRRTPKDHGLSWEPLTCRTDDGHSLIGWAVLPPRPRGTVVLLHGLRGSREQTLERAVFLAAAGYRSVAFDHRAHGESSGKRTSFGYYEANDATAILELTRSRWPNEPLAALGISMGAAALCFASGQTRDLRAIILESLYHDIGSAFTSRIGTAYPAWFKRLRQGVIWMTELRLNLRLSDLAPVQHIAALDPAPVLLLTGTEDGNATPDDVRRLYESCRGPREMWLVPGAGHRDVFEIGGLAYQQQILNFLDRWLHEPVDRNNR